MLVKDTPIKTLKSSLPALSPFLRILSRSLEQAGIDSPRLSAELLLAHSMGISRQDLLKELILSPESVLSEHVTQAAESLTKRRATGEPAAYLIGHREFYGRDFTVTPAVLIPRPETELLVDTALALAQAHTSQSVHGRQRRFADFGTGSGCIAITLALELRGWQGLALDRSAAALDIARANALRLGAPGLTFALADFCQAPLAAQSLDLLLSNPPYISEEEYRELGHEVQAFEPRSALVPGLPNQPSLSVPPGQLDAGAQTPSEASGLEDVKAVALQAELLVRPGGHLLMEIGHSQAEAALAALNPAAWSETRVLPDLAGLSRLLVAKKQ